MCLCQDDDICSLAPLVSHKPCMASPQTMCPCCRIPAVCHLVNAVLLSPSSWKLVHASALSMAALMDTEHLARVPADARFMHMRSSHVIGRGIAITCPCIIMHTPTMGCAAHVELRPRGALNSKQAMSRPLCVLRGGKSWQL